MTVQGNLATIGQGPDNLLRSIYRDKLTGRLSIFYENEQRRNVQDVIFLEQGMVIGLKSLDKYGVKEMLVFARKLTKEQVADAARKAQQAGEGKTAEQILLEEGVITRQSVIHAIATLIRGCIQRILTKPYGLFIFHPSDQLKGVRAMTRVSMLQIILDYSRALDRPEVFRSVVPSSEHVPVLAVNIEDIRQRFHLTEDEWRLLYQVDGERTITDAFNEAGFERNVGLKLLYAMQMCDFVRLQAPAQEEAAPPVRGTDSSVAPSLTPQPVSRSGSLAPPPPAGAAPAAGPSSEAPAIQAEEAEGEEAPPEEERPTEGTILVVDDSKTIQKMVELALKDLPYKLVMADDGFMALELAQQVDPDLVILDVIMPKLDGYKTCGQLKKVFAPKKVPVIMLTARDGTFDKIKGRLAGASMYIAKPFESEELQAAVSKFMVGAHS